MPGKRQLVKATPAEKETIIKNRYTKSTLKNIEGVCSRWTELFGSSVCVDSFNDENISELLYALWKTHHNRGQVSQFQMFCKFNREKFRFVFNVFPPKSLLLLGYLNPLLPLIH